MGDRTLVLSARMDSGESEGDGIHTSRRCDLYRQHIGHFLTCSRCDQLKSSCLATPLSQSPINMTPEMTRLSCSPISVEIRIPSSSSGSERKPTSFTEVSGFEWGKKSTHEQRLPSHLWRTFVQDRGEGLPLIEIGQAIRLTYPAKEGMKSFKRALGRFGHFGRISTEIPARIHCL